VIRTRMTRKSFARRVVVALAATLLFGAIMLEKQSGATEDEATKAAQEIFNTRCAVCHGPAGHGDGPGSAALNPKPRNFTDPEWQKSVTDEHIEKIIQYGGIAVGKSPMMPGNPDLISKQDVVKALRAKVRALGEKH